MHLNPELRRAVLFIGVDEVGTRKLKGTGFAIAYEGDRYLVTCAHIARGLRNRPFWIRVNGKGDEPVQFIESGEPTEIPWQFHSDDRVDVAVTPFGFPMDAPFDHRYLPESCIATADMILGEGIGLGDLTYTIGLFWRHSGDIRNIPVLHSGNIAALKEDGEIPHTIIDANGNTKQVSSRSYLVQTHAVQGLSGSPVFVRPVINLTDVPVDGEKRTVMLPQGFVFLLGVWTGSFEGMPSDALIQEIGEMRGSMTGSTERVTLGFGVVAPAERLVEILNNETLIHRRSRLQSGH